MKLLLVAAVVFFALGVTFCLGKGTILLAGMGRGARARKNKYDIQAWGKFLGKCMFGYCFVMLFLAIGMWRNSLWMFFAGMALFMCLGMFIFIYSNTKSRFKK